MNAMQHDQTITFQVRTGVIAMAADEPGRFTAHTASRVLAGALVQDGRWSRYVVPNILRIEEARELIDGLIAEGTIELDDSGRMYLVP